MPPAPATDTTMKKLFRTLDWLEESLLALLLAAMTLVTFGQVVARYVFNSGAVWALELSIFLFAWLVLMGASYGIRVRAHIGVDLLVRLMPNRIRRALALLAVVLGLLYCAIMFKGGWDTVALLHMIQIEAEDLPVQRWIPTLALPIGMGLLALRLLQVGWAILRGNSEGLLANETEDALAQVRQGDDAGAAS
jgi:C4-dicarboxylate transporter DctQ subunit